MALYIVTEECISCGDCEPVCPTDSIKEGKVVFEINASSCNECEGQADSPQCIDVCPVDDCILPLAS